MKEIEERFDGEWALLEGPIDDKRGQTVSAKLRWHSKERAEIGVKMLGFRLKYGAVLYIGEGSEGIFYCY